MILNCASQREFLIKYALYLNFIPTSNQSNVSKCARNMSTFFCMFNQRWRHCFYGTDYVVCSNELSNMLTFLHMCTSYSQKSHAWTLAGLLPSITSIFMLIPIYCQKRDHFLRLALSYLVALWGMRSWSCSPWCWLPDRCTCRHPPPWLWLSAACWGRIRQDATKPPRWAGPRSGGLQPLNKTIARFISSAEFCAFLRVKRDSLPAPLWWSWICSRPRVRPSSATEWPAWRHCGLCTGKRWFLRSPRWCWLGECQSGWV